MRTKIIFLMTLFLSLVLITTTADARRFGGGSRSYSRSWSKANRTYKVAPSSGYKKSNFFNSKNSSRRSAMKGAFMGLLAGTMIGSLLGGHGFAGFQFLDMLLLFGFCFLVFRAIGHFKRNQEFRQ